MEPSELQHRLLELEQRMSAIERCFLNTPPGPGPTSPGEGGAPPDSGATPTADNPASGPEAKANGQEPLFDGLPYRLTGTAEDGLITDVLQLLASNRKTGRFSLFVDEPKDRFDIFYRVGRICHAKAGEAIGDTAFFLLMVTAHRQGYYGFLETDEGTDCEDTISANTEFLVLEALRRIDEEQNNATE